MIRLYQIIQNCTRYLTNRLGLTGPLTPTHHLAGLLLVGGLTLALSSCSPEKEPIVFGTDQCNFCKMTIVDQRYGAELVSTTGKVYKFDALECLVNARCRDEEMKNAGVHSMYVVDFNQPGTLVPVESSFYLHSQTLPSPMGMFLTGFAQNQHAVEAAQQYTGDILNWTDVQLLVNGSDSCD